VCGTKFASFSCYFVILESNLLLLAAICIFGFLGYLSFYFIDLLNLSCKQIFYVLYVSSARSWRILMQYYTSQKKNMSDSKTCIQVYLICRECLFLKHFVIVMSNGFRTTINIKLIYKVSLAYIKQFRSSLGDIP